MSKSAYRIFCSAGVMLQLQRAPLMPANASHHSAWIDITKERSEITCHSSKLATPLKPIHCKFKWGWTRGSLSVCGVFADVHINDWLRENQNIPRLLMCSVLWVCRRKRFERGRCLFRTVHSVSLATDHSSSALFRAPLSCSHKWSGRDSPSENEHHWPLCSRPAHYCARLTRSDERDARTSAQFTLYLSQGEKRSHCSGLWLIQKRSNLRWYHMQDISRRSHHHGDI